MNWYATLDRLQAILALSDDAELVSAWDAFSAEVKRAEHHPYHIERIRLELDAMTLSRGGGAVRVLDHGCGPGSTLIYLAALGYTDSFGVDVSGNKNSAQNRLARLCWGRRYDCFLEYDGRTLPFADHSFDLVISQQVVEHVPDAEYEAYFAEEGRVLAPGGVALHQIPHKLVPYDSHTGAWVLPMLPDRVAQTVMKALGGEWPDHVHLRWPWVHAGMIQKHIGPFRNLSAERLTGLQDIAYYDGPKGLRGLIARVCALPGVGPVFARGLSNFVLMETRAEKR